MTKIIAGLLAAFLFIGCSAKTDENVKPRLVVGTTIADMTLSDQFDKPLVISADTSKVIFAFSKDGAHICNDYFVTKSPTYLADNKTIFIADVSSAPSLIRSMFIMPGLKDFKHPVYILDDKVVATGYRADMDTEKIVVVDVENLIIKNIKTISSEKELVTEIESK